LRPENVWEVLVQSQARSSSTELWRWFQRRFREALVQSHIRFNRVSEKVPEKVPEKVGEALVQSQVRFNRVPEKVPEKVSGGFGAEPGQVQQGSGEGSGEGLGGFGAEPGSTKVPEKVPRNHGAKPSQVQRVLEKVAEKFPEKVLGILGAGPGQVQQVQQGFQRLASQHALKRFVKIATVGDTAEAYFRLDILIWTLAPRIFLAITLG